MMKLCHGSFFFPINNFQAKLFVFEFDANLHILRSAPSSLKTAGYGSNSCVFKMAASIDICDKLLERVLHDLS